MNLFELKDVGHQLLEEYISLDFHRTPKGAKKHAYEKLGTKMKNGEYFHFGQMKTEEEIVLAINKLKKMVKSRKHKIEFMALDKVKIADNVIELQKEANKLNKNYHEKINRISSK